jgi:hypothetical protein
MLDALKACSVLPTNSGLSCLGTTATEILLETQEGHAEIGFLRAVGLEQKGQQISVVAGA